MSIVGGAGRFNHNVGWSELGVIWSEDGVGLKVDTIFTVCPLGERGEGPGDMVCCISDFVVDGCFRESFAVEKVITVMVDLFAAEANGKRSVAWVEGGP